MFQNIADQELEQGKIENKTIVKNKVKEIFKFSNIFLYLVSFLASTVSFGNLGSPFAVSLFAATCSNKIPAGIIYVLSGLGVLLKFGVNDFLIYLFTTLVFIVSVIIFKPKEEYEDRNEKRKLGKHVFMASILVKLLSIVLGPIYIYDVITGIAFSILSYLFYKIFVNGIVVIREFRERVAFSIEEIMAGMIIVTLAITALGEISVYGFSIRSILCVLMVLVLGWKNGVLVGGTAGITIGVILGIAGGESPLVIAAFAISGMIAGILNRLRKNRSYTRICNWKYFICLCGKWKYSRNYSVKRDYNSFFRLIIST